MDQSPIVLGTVETLTKKAVLDPQNYIRGPFLGKNIISINLSHFALFAVVFPLFLLLVVHCQHVTCYLHTIEIKHWRPYVLICL